jgi:hypothetical protein
MAATLAEHAPLIAGEVLAVSFGPGDPAAAGGTGPGEDAGPARDASGAAGQAGRPGDGGVAGPWHRHADDGLGLRFWLAVAG